MKRTTVALLLGVLCFRCATVVNGRNEALPVISNPEGADVLVTCTNVDPIRAVTPAVIQLPRMADGCLVILTKRGYRAHEVRVDRVESKAVRGNVIPGAIIGVAGGAVGLLVGLLSGDDEFMETAVGVGAAGGYAAGTGGGNMIDRKTGGAYKHSPSKIEVVLEQEP